MQMRLMRIGLRHFLYKINETISDRCSGGEGSQTLQYILLQCLLYIGLKKALMDNVRLKTNIVGTNYKAIISYPLISRYITQFILQTSLLGQFHYCDLEKEPKEVTTESN